MSIFKRYLLLIFSVTIISIFSLRWYAMEFLYRTPEKFWGGMPTTLGATVFLIIILLIIVFRLTRPFNRIIQKVKSGVAATIEETQEALGIYKKMNTLTIAANILGFFIGQIVVVFIEVKQGVTEYNLARILFSIIQATLIGALSASYTIFILNELFAPFRKLLKIHETDIFGKHQTMNINTTILIIASITLLYMCCNSLSVSYEIINRQSTIPVENALAEFFTGGISVCIMSFLPAFGILWFVLRNLKKRIQETSSLIHEMGKKGNLAARIDITMLDDFGMLTGSINSFMAKLSDIITNLRQESAVVAESAVNLTVEIESATAALTQMAAACYNITAQGNKQEELIVGVHTDIVGMASSAESIEKEVEDQSSAVQQSSASIAQMVANINSVAEISKKAGNISTTLTSTSTEGNEAIKQAIISIEEIQSSSLEVQNIIKVIQKIASQTNLLSMNAAIEAAHAGTAGQGFAVVADEVRSLAASSAKSAKEINTHINDMVNKINAGVEAIKSAGNAFKNITENVDDTSGLIQTIANAMEEQRVGAKETLDATNYFVASVSKIKTLSEKQTEYSKSVDNAMNTVVEASNNVTTVIKEASISCSKLTELVEIFSKAVENNEQAVTKMNGAMEIFKV